MILLCLFATILLSLSVKADYQDILTRTNFYPVAAAAYSDTPGDCLKNRFANATLKRQVVVKCDNTSVNTCSGFTGVSHDDKAILLVYRGTISDFQLATESEDTIVGPHINWVSGGWVSHYFYNGFTLLWNAGMKDDFLSLVNKYPSYNIWVTGHSLGAAMAVVSATYVTQLGYTQSSQVNLITFGEPRIGDHQFAASVDRLIPSAYRVVHAKDVVAHEPTKDHHGGFYHHKTEVWYPGDMKRGANYTICTDSAESEQCSDGQTDHSFEDHMWYFGVQIMKYGRGGCHENL